MLERLLLESTHQASEIVLKVVELTSVLKPVTEGSRVSGHQGSRGDYRKLHQTFTQVCKMMPKVSHGTGNAKTQQSS